MENENKQNYSYIDDSEEIDFSKYIEKFKRGFKRGWSNKRGIRRICALFFVIGLVLAFTTPKQYTVVASIAPEFSTKSSGGNLSSIASMLGMGSMLNANMSSDAVRPDLYPQLIQSKRFIIELFDLQVEIEDDNGNTSIVTYYEYLSEHQKSSLVSKIFSAPFNLLNLIRDLLSPEEEDNGATHKLDPFKLTKKESAMVELVSKKKVSTKLDKKSYVVTITVKDQDPLVAATVSKGVIRKLKKLITDYRTEKVRKDLEYYKLMNSRAEQEYYEAQERYAKFVDSNIGPVKESVIVQKQRLMNEMNLKFQLYTTMSQNMLQAQAQVQRENPVIAEIELPSVPTKGSPSKLSIIIKSLLFGFIFSIFWYAKGKSLWEKFRSRRKK